MYHKIETDRVGEVCKPEERTNERIRVITGISCKTPDQLEFIRYVNAVEIVHRFRTEGAKCEWHAGILLGP